MYGLCAKFKRHAVVNDILLPEASTFCLILYVLFTYMFFYCPGEHLRANKQSSVSANLSWLDKNVINIAIEPKVKARVW